MYVKIPIFNVFPLSEANKLNNKVEKTNQKNGYFKRNPQREVTKKQRQQYFAFKEADPKKIRKKGLEFGLIETNALEVVGTATEDILTLQNGIVIITEYERRNTSVTINTSTTLYNLKPEAINIIENIFSKYSKHGMVYPSGGFVQKLKKNDVPHLLEELEVVLTKLDFLYQIQRPDLILKARQYEGKKF